MLLVLIIITSAQEPVRGAASSPLHHSAGVLVMLGRPLRADDFTFLLLLEGFLIGRSRSADSLNLVKERSMCEWSCVDKYLHRPGSVMEEIRSPLETETNPRTVHYRPRIVIYELG